MSLELMLGAADRCAGALGWLSQPFDALELLARAERRTGLHHQGDRSFMGPLQRLLDACVAEADLSVVGRFAVRWDTVRFLSNLLRLGSEEVRNPRVLEEPIDRPIFITGLPRSGTTFLHRLMLEDAFNRAPKVWETIYPYPPLSGRDDRISQVGRQLRNFERIAPEFRSLHPLSAESPQECSEVAAHVFRSLRFDTTYRIPSYRRWLDADGHLEAYQFQRRFLQHLQCSQHQKGRGRWVLKCPDHLFALRDLRAAFPRARVVFVHRDPMKVLLSVCKLTEVLRQPFSRRVDKLEIGRQESARWLAGTERMIRACRDSMFVEPICHIHYSDLVRSPLKTVTRVYDHFRLDMDGKTAGRIAQAVAEHPNGGYGRHAYRFEEHGLTAAAEQEKFRPYMEYFSIDPEPRRARVEPLPARSRAA